MKDGAKTAKAAGRRALQSLLVMKAHTAAAAAGKDNFREELQNRRRNISRDSFLLDSETLAQNLVRSTGAEPPVPHSWDPPSQGEASPGEASPRKPSQQQSRRAMTKNDIKVVDVENGDRDDDSRDSRNPVAPPVMMQNTPRGREVMRQCCRASSDKFSASMVEQTSVRKTEKSTALIEDNNEDKTK